MKKISLLIALLLPVTFLPAQSHLVQTNSLQGRQNKHSFDTGTNVPTGIARDGARSQPHLSSDFSRASNVVRVEGISCRFPHDDFAVNVVQKTPTSFRPAVSPHSQVYVVDTALVYSTYNTKRHSYAFNGQAKMTIALEERWTNNQWVNSGRVIHVYDANANRLTELYQGWTNNQWMNFSRYTYTYDGNGNRLTELNEYWLTNQWVNWDRYTHTYDANGNKLTELYEQWTSNQWESHSRGTFTYDANGRMLTELYEQWTNSQWVNSSRYTYTYDVEGRILTALNEEWTNSQWVNYSQWTFTYDGNGNRLTELYEQWVTNLWVSYRRFTYTYDSNGNMATGQCEEWQGGIWLPQNIGFSVADSADNFYYWFPACRVMLRYRLVTTDVAGNASEMPTQYELSPNYPNPFNPTTTIEFRIQNSQPTILKVYDILGREVATLLNEEKSAGTYTVQWDATGVSSGVYFYRIKAGDFVQTKRMMVVR